MKIEIATENDIEQIGPLWIDLMRIHEEFEPTFFKDTKDNVSLYLSQLGYRQSYCPTERIFVLRDDSNPDTTQNIKGYIWGNITYSYSNYNSDKIGSINDIYIHPELQGSGYGRQLTSALLKWFAEVGAQKLTVFIVNKNERSLKLFESFGFKPLGTKLSLDINQPE